MPQPHKGLRKQISIRMPMSLYYRIATAAHRNGIPINDAYVDCLRRGLIGLEEGYAQSGRSTQRTRSDRAQAVGGDL